MRDLHELPKLRDSLSYLYVERGRINQKHKAVEFVDKDGGTMIPAAALSVLMLGPGIAITHAAIKALADNGCLIVWVGEDGTRCYAQGAGETRKAYHLLHQAKLATNPEKRMEVVRRMYQHRFRQKLAPGLSLQQVRGLEGQRVRQAYARASRRFGVQWHGRRYDRGRWGSGDPANRALSLANALLNGLCHANNDPSSTMSPIYTKRRSPFQWRSEWQRHPRIESTRACASPPGRHFENIAF